MAQGIEAGKSTDLENLVKQPTRKPWAKGRVVVVLVLVAAAIATAVVVPVCVVVGCPARPSSSKDDMQLGPPRLLVHFANSSIDALALVPVVLQPFVTRLLLQSSSMQLLTFATDEVLQEVTKFIKAEPSLNILTRDFLTNLVPVILDPGGPLPSGAQDSVLVKIWTQMGTAVASAVRGFIAALPGGLPLLEEDDPLVPFFVDDPLYVNGSQYYADLVNATGAWNLATGSPEVIVAVIDSGVYLDHPDIKDNLWVNRGEIPGNGIDDDGNGYVDDVFGYAFAGVCTSTSPSGSCQACGGTGSPSPSLRVDRKFYHGTHVAGLVAAAQNNQQGVTGIAAGVKVMNLRVSNCMDGGIAASTVFEALDYAHRMGAHVVSMAIGSTYQYGFSPTAPAPSYHAQWTASYQQALQPLADKGMLVVVAAGNDNIDLDSLATLGWAYTPCVVNISTLICVGATDASDQRAAFSNFGQAYVHIGSPGVHIYSALIQNVSGVPNPTYGPLNGTSMATPIVSAAAALTLSVLGASDGNYFKGMQAKSILMSSGSKPSSGPALPFVSASRINSGLALWQAASQLQPVVVSPVHRSLEAVPGTLSFQGIAERYFSGGLSIPGVEATPFDVSVRNISRANNQPTSFTTFKHSTGAMVSLQALIRLNSAGVWSVRVTTGGSTLGGATININGQQVQLNATTGIGVFITTNPGWYDMQLKVSNPQSPPYRLLLKSPRANTFKLYYGYLVTGPRVVNVTYNSSTSLPDTWLVTSCLAAQAQPLRVELSALTLGQATCNQTLGVAQLVDPTAASLARRLSEAQGGSFSQPVIGSLTTLLLPSVAWDAPVALKVSCVGCQLLVDRTLVVDIFEPLLSTSSVIGSVIKTSPCITLAGGMVHQLSLSFVLRSATDASPAISYAKCIPQTSPPEYTSLTGMIASPVS